MIDCARSKFDAARHGFKVLRVALDEFLRAHSGEPGLFYSPPFEITKEYFRDPYRGDNRYVRGDVIKQIMQNFAKHYLIGD